MSVIKKSFDAEKDDAKHPEGERIQHQAWEKRGLIIRKYLNRS